MAKKKTVRKSTPRKKTPTRKAPAKKKSPSKTSPKPRASSKRTPSTLSPRVAEALKLNEAQLKRANSKEVNEIAKKVEMPTHPIANGLARMVLATHVAQVAGGGPISNAYSLSRAGLAKALFDDRRDYDDECGYPKTHNLTPEIYQALYDRESLATRVVQVLPRECWQRPPHIFEKESTEDEDSTAFEQAFQDLSMSIRGQSWHRDEHNNGLWEYLQRLDIQSRIGHFGCMLIGLDDTKAEDDLSKPVEGYNEKTGEIKRTRDRKLLFLRVFPETLATVAVRNDNQSSVRFGMPEAYKLTFVDTSAPITPSVIESSQTKDVHWTRVIHAADNLGASELIGVPAMRPVMNRILDSVKLYGGSAEMFWRGAFPGYSIETHPSLGGDVEVDEDAVTEQMENFTNSLQRYLAISGAHVNSLSPVVADPSAHLEAIITAICIVLEIPKRVFMGSERGELASSEDKDSWNERKAARQVNYLTPRIVVPTIDRFIQLGVLPEPKEYHIDWPDFDTLSDESKAKVQLMRTQADAAYIAGDVSSLIHPRDYLMESRGLTKDEADALLDSAEDFANDGGFPDVEDPELERQQQLEDSERSHQQAIELEQVKQSGKAPKPPKSGSPMGTDPIE